MTDIDFFLAQTERLTLAAVTFVLAQNRLRQARQRKDEYEVAIALGDALEATNDMRRVMADDLPK